MLFLYLEINLGLSLNFIIIYIISIILLIWDFFTPALVDGFSFGD